MVIIATALAPAAQIGFATPKRPKSFKESVLYNFCSASNCSDGSYPYGSLLGDKSGNLYGTTAFGGTNEGGTVFDLHPNGKGGWTETVLYGCCSQSSCFDGWTPGGPLVMDSSGDIYGSTSQGGHYGCGVAFELTNSKGMWVENVILDFQGPIYGCGPTGLTMDTSGNLHGVMGAGGDTQSCYPGEGCGVVFELTPSKGGWTENVLYTFGLNGSADGIFPSSPVKLDAKGNIYGEAKSCLVYNCQGTVYELTAEGAYSILYKFSGKSDGKTPEGGLVLNKRGNIYGTTDAGGAHNDGTVFKLTPGGKETVLHSFSGPPDGTNPDSGLAIDPAGNLYGTTVIGGNAGGNGIFFELSSQNHWKETAYSFKGSTGSVPYGFSLIQSEFYGTTNRGGINSAGVVYRIVP